MAKSTEQGGTQDRLMTVSEVATALRVSTMTVYRLINGGDLPAARIGRSFRVRPQDLERYLSNQFNAAG
jgi:excisionase family DNA binding protein